MAHPEPGPRASLPERLETPRLVARRWRAEDAPRLVRAIAENLEHLRAWMAWAMDEPSPAESVEVRLLRFGERFLAGDDWSFALLDRNESRVLGGLGVHRTADPATLEIGYWLAADVEGRGLMTEAASAVIGAVRALPGITRLEIHCDPRNLRSAAVARRLGFRHVRTIPNETSTPTGEPRDTMVWVLELSARPVA